MEKKKYEAPAIIRSAKVTFEDAPLDVLFDAIAIWQRETFGDARSVEGAIRHIEKEAVEVRFAWTNHKLHKTPKKEFAEELADIFFMVVQAVDVAGVDLKNELAMKLAKNKARKWKKPDGDGVIEHVKGGGE